MWFPIREDVLGGATLLELQVETLHLELRVHTNKVG